MPHRRETEDVLARWREAERQLVDIVDDTPEAEALRAEAARLRNEFHALVDLAAKAEHPALLTPREST
ncbi:MAG TPA: hypothetical protein VGQ89_01330 [Candidatus Limnocylindrales bacterium]|jgi:hypothetical protein|nr:hypothetical protein [Candidatus Limnocylindrales bacterium]